MAFKGADAPPHVILHGPSGQVFDTGSGNAPVEANGFAALKNDQTDITEIVIETPAALNSPGAVSLEPALGRLLERPAPRSPAGKSRIARQATGRRRRKPIGPRE